MNDSKWHPLVRVLVLLLKKELLNPNLYMKEVIQCPGPHRLSIAFAPSVINLLFPNKPRSTASSILCFQDWQLIMRSRLYTNVKNLIYAHHSGQAWDIFSSRPQSIPHPRLPSGCGTDLCTQIQSVHLYRALAFCVPEVPCPPHPSLPLWSLD